MARKTELLFQFQNGSIKSREWLRVLLMHSGFNSKMVQLKDGNVWKMIDGITVSIPKWFN